MKIDPVDEGPSPLGRARRLSELGLAQMDEGRVRRALDLFDESIALFATAEGLTYRGQAYSRLDDYVKAIADCRRAIRLDGRYGKSYNDIGIYLVALGHLDEAEVWLVRATTAIYYPERLDAYLNLGRLYMLLDEQNKALPQFVKALELDPGNREAKRAIADMEMHF